VIFRYGQVGGGLLMLNTGFLDLARVIG